MLNFNGKHAIVTGAARGIGLATTKLLVENGAEVLMVDVNEKALEEARESLNELSAKTLIFVCDVSDETRVDQAVAYALEKFGAIEILINNAGIFREGCVLFENSQSSTWKKKIDINILGTMYFTKAVLGHMLENGYGKIVNLASVVAVYGKARMVDYSMTKGAIVSFTKALAKEVTGRGVYVNAVSPGSIDGVETANPGLSFMGRSGLYSECAQLICFLASDDASYIAGQNYQIDGLRKMM